MIAKTARILAQVEPEVKEKAWEIMAQLGVPASVVINMLYKQIIMTKGIPFNISFPDTPKPSDEMSVETFKEMMHLGFKQAKSDVSRPAVDVFADLRQGL